jgi:hypothetical protein
MFCWPITARWVLNNGKFVLSVPYPVAQELVSISNIYSKDVDMHIEGHLKQNLEMYINGNAAVRSCILNSKFNTGDKSKPLHDLRLSELK